MCMSKLFYNNITITEYLIEYIDPITDASSMAEFMALV